MPFTHKSKKARNKEANFQDFISDVCSGLAKGATGKIKKIMKRSAKEHKQRARKLRNM